MEAKELRIGNYINVQQEDCQVVKLTKNRIATNGINNNLLYDEKLVYGIPLTEEWLLKFGFIHRIKKYSLNMSGESFDFFFIDGCGFGIWRHPQGFSLKEFTNPNDFYIDYVHQLQNLYFALTGKELEVNQTNPSL